MQSRCESDPRLQVPTCRLVILQLCETIVQEPMRLTLAQADMKSNAQSHPNHDEEGGCGSQHHVTLAAAATAAPRAQLLLMYTSHVGVLPHARRPCRGWQLQLHAGRGAIHHPQYLPWCLSCCIGLLLRPCGLLLRQLHPKLSLFQRRGERGGKIFRLHSRQRL
jgi:hypothetical protein